MRREVRDHINFTAMGLILYSLIGLVFLLPSDFLWEGRFYWHMAALGAVAGIDAEIGLAGDAAYGRLKDFADRLVSRAK